MQTVLITGVAGFIGSSLAEKVINDHIIVGLDDFNDYYSPTIKEKNIAMLRKHKNFKIYHGDIRDEKLLKKIFSKNKIDKIVHLAARAGVRPSLINPSIYLSTNILGTNQLLKTAVKYKVRQFIFASSSSIYGNNKKVPFAETDATEHPISPYAISKLAGEKLCWLYGKTYKIPVTVLRFFSVYGPRGRPDMAPYIFTKKILNGEAIEVYGDGSQARDFTYIDDIADGIIRAVKKPFNFEIINLGNSYSVSVAHLIRTLEKITRKKARIKYSKKRLGDVEKTFADIRVAKKLLNWQPKTKIDEGMKKFINWYALEKRLLK